MTINARIADFDAAAVNRRTREAFRFPTWSLIKDKTPGATDYTLTVIESAKRIMEYKRMINRIRKARAEKEAA